MEEHFIIGEKFEDQIERIRDPHRYEGNIYQDSGDETWMFCQVGPHTFAFICLNSGNRVFTPMEMPNTTMAGRYELLSKMSDHVSEHRLIQIENPFHK